MTKIKQFILEDGERFCLLVSSMDGVPQFYPNLFMISQFRNASLSLSRMEKSLSSIQVLLLWSEMEEINIEDRVKSQLFLTLEEIDSLTTYCQWPLAFLREELKPGSSLKRNVLSFPKSPQYNRVSKQLQYTRLTDISNYLYWLTRKILKNEFSSGVKSVVDLMYKTILSKRPKNKSSKLNFSKTLSDETMEFLKGIITPSHPLNPFKATAHRNYLMITLLIETGMRRSELLALRVEDIDHDAINIQRLHDDPSDPRLYQPRAKTLPRKIPLRKALIEEIHKYVLNERRLCGKSRNHPYLFVSLSLGAERGMPISLSGFKQVFKKLAEVDKSLKGVHPHALRHTWNYNFSKLMDKQKKLENYSQADEEKIRSYLMGWKEGSGTAAVYNQRHIIEKANQVSLQLQEAISLGH